MLCSLCQLYQRGNAIIRMLFLRLNRNVYWQRQQLHRAAVLKVSLPFAWSRVKNQVRAGLKWTTKTHLRVRVQEGTAKCADPEAMNTLRKRERPTGTLSRGSRKVVNTDAVRNQSSVVTSNSLAVFNYNKAVSWHLRAWFSCYINSFPLCSFCFGDTTRSALRQLL